MFRPQWVLQEEEVERLQLLCKSGRLNRVQPLVRIMQQLDLISKLLPEICEQAWNDPEILCGLPIELLMRHRTAVSKGNPGSGGPRGRGGLFTAADSVGAAGLGDGALGSDTLK